jgi:hypothetical protein
LGLKVRGFGFRVSSFGFRVSGLGFEGLTPERPRSMQLKVSKTVADIAGYTAKNRKRPQYESAETHASMLSRNTRAPSHARALEGIAKS